MITFGNLRPREEVLKLFENFGWGVDVRAYEDDMSDWTFFTDPHDCMRVQWADFNGHFRGERISGQKFSHLSSEFDDEDWYKTLLNIFYITKEVTTCD
jgi:hypothetical protein